MAPPDRRVLALFPAPLPREERDDLAPDPYADAADPRTARAVDALLEDTRADRARAWRFRRRSSRVLLGIAARTRRIERGQWLMAGDVSRSLASTRNRSTVAAGAPVVVALVWLLKFLIGG